MAVRQSLRGACLAPGAPYASKRQPRLHRARPAPAAPPAAASRQARSRRAPAAAAGDGADSASREAADLLLLRLLGELPADAGERRRPQGQLRQGIINPQNPVYRAWWGLLIGAAAFTGIFVPWELGFSDLDLLYLPSNAATWVDLALVGLFCADIAVSHCVAYETDELLVDDPALVASNYRRNRLALDVISAVPFDWLAYAATAAVATAAVTAVPDVLPSAASSPAAGTGAAAAALTAARTSPALASSLLAAPPLADAAGALAAGGTQAAATAAAVARAEGAVTPAIACLKLLHLVRLYRVRWFFRYLEYDLTVSLLSVTVGRNLVIVAYLTHWVACGFNFLARSGGYDPDLLVGLNPDLFASISTPEQYVYSLYWSVTTLAGNEWNGMDTVTDMRQVVANTFRASVFLLTQIALGAYILGTITLLVVKNDERTGRYRDLSSNLKTYSTINQLPADLKDEMQEHLRLKFNHQEASDDQVLSIYPTTIRRRILRHLYLRHLRASYLFRGTPRKFLDSLLAASRLELFSPGVEVLSAGDPVNELFVVVAGKVELRSPLDPSVSQYDWGGDLVDSQASQDPMSSMLGELDPDMQSGPGASVGGGPGVYLGPTRQIGPGELFGEISFFTEIPQMETVRSLTSVRVMVISRSAIESVERNFPIASRLVLENLKRHSEAAVSAEFPGLNGTPHDLQTLLASCPGSLMYSWASPELVELMGYSSVSDGSSSSSSSSGGGGGAGINSTSSLASLSYDSLDLPADAPPAAIAAAAAARERRGTRAGGARRASLAAAGGGRGGAAAAGAGGVAASRLTARQELVLSNLVRVLAVITQHVAKQEEDRTTDFLYAATRGDVLKLRSMLQQGFCPDSADYDARTALMLAAVKGHRDVVDLLLAAGANPNLDDNMGRSALLEACYHGHDAIIDTLTAAGVRLAPHSMATAATASAPRGPARPAPSSDSGGSEGAAGPRPTPAGARFGSALGSDASAAAPFGSLAGGEPGLSSGAATSWSLQLASLLCNCVYECNLPLLRRLLRAGAPVDIGDYDKRTALHISAAEGNAVMVRVLVEEGGASVSVQDRWGNRPLDEARRVGAAPVVAYLEAAALAQREAAVAARRAAAAEAAARLRGSMSGGGGAAAVAAARGPGGSRIDPSAAAAALSVGSGAGSSWRALQRQQAALADAAMLQALQRQQAQAVRGAVDGMLAENGYSPAPASPGGSPGASRSPSSSRDGGTPEPPGGGGGRPGSAQQQAGVAAKPAAAAPAASSSGGGGSSSSRGGGSSSSRGRGSNEDAVIELQRLAQAAQQRLTLAVEEMELQQLESLQAHRTAGGSGSSRSSGSQPQGSGSGQPQGNSRSQEAVRRQ